MANKETTMAESRTVSGVKEKPDTKSKRKFETEWGTFYVPLEVCRELGATDRMDFTVSAPDDGA